MPAAGVDEGAVEVEEDDVGGHVPSMGRGRAAGLGRLRAGRTGPGHKMWSGAATWRRPRVLWTPRHAVGHTVSSASFRREATFSQVTDALPWRVVQ